MNRTVAEETTLAPCPFCGSSRKISAPHPKRDGVSEAAPHGRHRLPAEAARELARTVRAELDAGLWDSGRPVEFFSRDGTTYEGVGHREDAERLLAILAMPAQSHLFWRTCEDCGACGPYATSGEGAERLWSARKG